MVKDKNYYKALRILKINPGYKDQKEYKLKFFQKSALRQREIMLHPEIYGTVTFFFVLSLKITNVFFTFYYKAANLPQKVFVLAKSSAGYAGRLLIKKVGNKSEIAERGRVKTSMFQIYNRLNMFRGFIFHMLLYNYMCFKIFNCTVLFKFYRQPDYITNRLLIAKMPCEKVYEIMTHRRKLIDPEINYFYRVQHCFPHGGCRPKSIRNIKKKARKKQQKLLAKHYVDPGLNAEKARYFHKLNEVEVERYVTIAEEGLKNKNKIQK